MTKAKDIVLVLDIDRTLWSAPEMVKKIDPRHTLSSWMPVMVRLGSHCKQHRAAILNVFELSDLIEYACVHYGGIMIVTAGNYDEKSVKRSLIRRLYVNERTRFMIEKCPFLAPEIAALYFPNLSSNEIRYIYKNDWIQRYYESRNEHNKRLVIVDDDKNQLVGYLKNKQVFALIHATTSIRETLLHENPLLFYQAAKSALDQAKTKEKRFALFSNTCPCFKQDKLKTKPESTEKFLLVFPTRLKIFFESMLLKEEKRTQKGHQEEAKENQSLLTSSQRVMNGI